MDIKSDKRPMSPAVDFLHLQGLRILSKESLQILFPDSWRFSTFVGCTCMTTDETIAFRYINAYQQSAIYEKTVICNYFCFCSQSAIMIRSRAKIIARKTKSKRQNLTTNSQINQNLDANFPLKNRNVFIVNRLAISARVAEIHATFDF